MRVALFFDGMNFYAGWRAKTSRDRIDFEKLSEWLVRQVRGEYLWGAYYYTGVAESAEGVSDDNLERFLTELETVPGFFVRRFQRRFREMRCPKCGEMNQFTVEKEVDTTLVADALRLAAVNAFDIMILMSGDGDLTPAVEGVRSLGKQVYVATWEEFGLSWRMRSAAFDHIDIARGLADFRATGRPESPVVVTQSLKDEFVKELQRAQRHFGDGYVGTLYFLRKWQGALPADARLRTRVLESLQAEGQVEEYETNDGELALRTITKDDDTHNMNASTDVPRY